MIFTRLKRLCEKANKGEAEISEELIEEFGTYCKDALRKQFTPNVKEFKIRMSQLGKNIRQQQGELLELEKDEEDEYNLSLKFLFGDITEAIVMTLMKAAGVAIQDEQKEVMLSIGGIDVKGTYDVKINNKIYDVKSCSPYAFSNKFQKGFKVIEETDTFGYVTQLYLYPEAEGCTAGGWIVINKVTGELIVVEPPIADNKYKRKHLKLAEDNVKTLLATTSLADIDISIPSIAELHYRKPTGKQILPDTYKYFPFKKVLWGDKIDYTENKLSKAKYKPKRYYIRESK